DQEVADFYKNNPNTFTIPKRYQLRVVVATSDDGKKKVDDALAAGKAFKDVASQMSEDVTKVTGGDFGLVPIDRIPEGPTREAIITTKIGQTTAWLQTGNAWAKYLLEDVKADELRPLTASLKRAVRRQLLLQRGSQKNNVAKDMAALRANST